MTEINENVAVGEKVPPQQEQYLVQIANDSYTGSFTLAHSAIPPELDFNITTGAVTLLPGAPYGVYSFAYTLCANGQCDTATVTVERRPKEFSRCDVYERAFFSSC